MPANNDVHVDAVTIMTVAGLTSDQSWPKTPSGAWPQRSPSYYSCAT